ETSDLGDSLIKFSQLTKDPQFLNESWQIQVAGQMAVWKVTYDDARKLDPPMRWREFHSEYLGGPSEIQRCSNGSRGRAGPQGRGSYQSSGRRS
ncbi:MAG: hypothetical protein ACREEA_08640, partial [Stellaceae bacterium]